VDQQPAAVPNGAKQAGSAPGPRDWVEPSVWTDRMLAALEQGGKGGVRRRRERWPNAFFAEQGLFSLKTAHAKLVSPL